MAYIGKQPTIGNFVKLDAITTSATATYNLLNGGVAYSPQSANHCIVSLNGVIQSPTTSFTISGSTIVFASALTATDVIDFILVLGDVLNIGTPSDATVGFSKVTSNLITGATAETSIAGGDSILIYDDSATALRKMTRTNFVSGLTGGTQEFAAGTVSLPSITTTGDTNTGVFFPAADTIAFTEGGTEAMRINSSGRVLIGATTQYAGAQESPLYVEKSGNFGTIFTHQTDAGGYNYNSNAFNNSGTYYHAQFMEANTQRGSITSNGSATAYNTGSDYRLKNNIKPMINSLNRVLQLKPSTFIWNSTNKNGEGFIAHEVQEIIPDAIIGIKDEIDDKGNPKYQGIDQSKLVPLLTGALQEAIAKIEQLEARLTALENN